MSFAPIVLTMHDHTVSVGWKLLFYYYNYCFCCYYDWVFLSSQPPSVSSSLLPPLLFAYADSVTLISFSRYTLDVEHAFALWPSRSCSRLAGCVGRFAHIDLLGGRSELIRLSLDYCVFVFFSLFLFHFQNIYLCIASRVLSVNAKIFSVHKYCNNKLYAIVYTSTLGMIIVSLLHSQFTCFIVFCGVFSRISDCLCAQFLCIHSCVFVPLFSIIYISLFLQSSVRFGPSVFRLYFET